MSRLHGEGGEIDALAGRALWLS